jgi:hypothetical protein
MELQKHFEDDATAPPKSYQTKKMVSNAQEFNEKSAAKAKQGIKS